MCEGAGFPRAPDCHDDGPGGHLLLHGREVRPGTLNEDDRTGLYYILAELGTRQRQRDNVIELISSITTEPRTTTSYSWE